MLDRYLAAVYEDGGRELPRVDCWGLTRLDAQALVPVAQVVAAQRDAA
ncbi:hypothetical protein [Pseudomonas aeruginosa]|nr:hypothetical protein [Pseudomonas aeruginosa]